VLAFPVARARWTVAVPFLSVASHCIVNSGLEIDLAYEPLVFVYTTEIVSEVTLFDRETFRQLNLVEKLFKQFLVHSATSTRQNCLY
jgi:hypothetical protein